MVGCVSIFTCTSQPIWRKVIRLRSQLETVACLANWVCCAATSGKVTNKVENSVEAELAAGKLCDSLYLHLISCMHKVIHIMALSQLVAVACLANWVICCAVNDGLAANTDDKKQASVEAGHDAPGPSAKVAKKAENSVEAELAAGKLCDSLYLHLISCMHKVIHIMALSQLVAVACLANWVICCAVNDGLAANTDDKKQASVEAGHDAPGPSAKVAKKAENSIEAKLAAGKLCDSLYLHLTSDMHKAIYIMTLSQLVAVACLANWVICHEGDQGPSSVSAAAPAETIGDELKSLLAEHLEAIDNKLAEHLNAIDNKIAPVVEELKAMKVNFYTEDTLLSMQTPRLINLEL